MSLEQSIQDLTAAVKVLTATIMASTAVAPEVVKETEVTHLVRDVPLEQFVEEQKSVIKKPKKEAPPTEPIAKTTTDTSPPSEPESAAVTYDDVKKATNALSAAKGRDATIAVLSRFGVKRATELDEGQWADYIAYAEKVIGEEA